MKTQVFSFQRIVTAILLFSFAFGQNLLAQDNPPTVYFKITKLKSQNDDFLNVCEEIMKPYVQERIKQGNQVAWGLSRVMYPQSSDAAYDYVSLDVFTDFNHLNLGGDKGLEIAANAFAGTNLSAVGQRFEASLKIVSSEVFVIRDEAYPGPNKEGPQPKYVVVNDMKVSEVNTDAYAKMEGKVFKPIHQARVKDGKMHDWILCQRVMPYGSEWDNTFITMDMFNEWGDMAGTNMGAYFAKVHPGKDPAALWGKMAGIRDLRRSETWEIVMSVDTPMPEITYDVVKEGTGASPVRGHEVTYKAKVMNTKGETIFSSQDLGFDFHSTIGTDLTSRFWDKGLMKMKKGGIMTLTLPPDAQSKETKAMLNGEKAVVKLELIDFGEPKPDGVALLREAIMDHDLATAKAKYQKLKSDNPKGYVFRESAMNGLGYMLLEKGKTDAAIYIFKINTERNPKSWNACDSLADGYRAAGNYAKAKHCYQMALERNPDFKAAKDKMEKL